MSCLRGKYGKPLGPIIDVCIYPLGKANLFTPPDNKIRALIDTGATHTCISPTVASTLSLVPLGIKNVASAHGVQSVNYYLIDLTIPVGIISIPFPKLQVTEFNPLAGSSYQVLLGMDIISRGVLILSSDGHFDFCL